MLSVAPSGRVVEATVWLTPRFFSATRMATGRTAALDEVEKATITASAISRKNGSAGRRAISRMTPPWTIRLWMAQPSTRAQASRKTWMKVSGPDVPITQATRARTPKGASSMITRTSTSMMSEPIWNSRATGAAGSPMISTPMPMRMAKKMTAGMSPLVRAANGLSGMMLIR